MHACTVLLAPHTHTRSTHSRETQAQRQDTQTGRPSAATPSPPPPHPPTHQVCQIPGDAALPRLLAAKRQPVPRYLAASPGVLGPGRLARGRCSERGGRQPYADFSTQPHGPRPAHQSFHLGGRMWVGAAQDGLDRRSSSSSNTPHVLLSEPGAIEERRNVAAQQAGPRVEEVGGELRLLLLSGCARLAAVPLVALLVLLLLLPRRRLAAVTPAAAAAAAASRVQQAWEQDRKAVRLLRAILQLLRRSRSCQYTEGCSSEGRVHSPARKHGGRWWRQF